MPAKNKAKVFGENTFYHTYNRGYNKQILFHDDHDYRTFLYLIKKYLEPGFKEKRFTPKGEEFWVEPNHVYDEVDLIAYCLMPNHFHLQLYQKSLKGMTKLLVRISSSYSSYYNLKYQTEGSPFQDTYKAIQIKTEEQLLHLSRYIHANPNEIVGPQDLKEYPYSSYVFYLNPQNNPAWLKTEFILNSFKDRQTYRSFVQNYLQLKEERKREELQKIQYLLLEG